MHRKKTGASGSRSGPQQLRIIGGDWRRRRIRFPDRPGIRPTPDRVRETLFNWLAPTIAGVRCLDLFAGSGALGLEALSRGAATAVFVEQDAAAAAALRETVAALAGGRGEVIRAESLAWLAGPARPFDLVFLDPPFGAGLLVPALERLERGGWLAAGARVYLEGPAGEEPVLPGGWLLHRSGRAGAVGYHLALRPGSAGEAIP